MESSHRSWEAIAQEFIAARSDIGSDVVRQWAKGLRPGSEVVDIGCGSGIPVSQTLVEAGIMVFGIDASPTLSTFPHQMGVGLRHWRKSTTA